MVATPPRGGITGDPSHDHERNHDHKVDAQPSNRRPKLKNVSATNALAKEDTVVIVALYAHFAIFTVLCRLQPVDLSLTAVVLLWAPCRLL